MPETASNPEQTVSDNPRRVNAAVVLGLAVLAVAFAFYLRLFSRIQGRDDVFAFFLHALLPAALIHTALLLLFVLGFRIRARGALIFWSISAAALLFCGGWTSFQAFVLILLFGFIVARIGSVIGRSLLPPLSRGWGISLALGLLALSAAGAFLAWFHLFTWWMLGILIVAALVPDLRLRMSALRADVGTSWNAFVSNWNLRAALSCEALFLLGAYAYVVSMAPETNSDAVRFYWPYIRLLRHYAGFFDVQRQWSYIIPQAGVTYATAVLSLLGHQAVRLSMLLAWTALAGMVCRRWTDQPRDVRFAVAVAVASCPVVLWVASSLMLDTFVCLAVAVLALLCVEGQKPGSIKFWVAIGACAATAWASKFTSLAYAVPLVAYASFRSFKAAGTIRTLRGLILSAVSFLIMLSPWLVNSYQQSGNPVFPFLSKLFPSPLWPRGVGAISINTYRLPPGWRGWLRWPIDLTYHTSRFVEGFDGKMGLTLLVLLILAIPVVWKGNAGSRALAAAGIFATALLWTQTAYLRYWLPSLWLMAMAACGPLEKRVGSRTAQFFIVSAAFVIMLPHALFGMVNYWSAPRGWPWEVYSQKITGPAYLGGQFQALSEELERSKALGNDWPKIWFTGYEAVGHLPVQPMEAATWELTLHSASPRSKIEYLSRAGCKFWIVNEDDQDAFWFKAEGISNFFWNEKCLVARSGPVAVYRMPTVEQALQEFDGRAAPGTELLLNGGFEIGKGGKPEFWSVDNDGRQFVPALESLEGRTCLQLRPKAGVRQGIALPPGTRSVEFVASARTSQKGQQAIVTYQLYTLGFEKDPATIPPDQQVQPQKALSGKSESVSIGDRWQDCRLVMDIPNLSQFIFVSIGFPQGSGEVWFDSVHLYSR
jgi:hypothetical protein